MASLLAPYGNPDALAVARDLDSKIEALLYRVCDVTTLLLTDRGAEHGAHTRDCPDTIRRGDSTSNGHKK